MIYNEIIDYYNKESKRSIKLTNKNRSLIDKALENKYSKDDIFDAINGCLNYDRFVDIKYKTLEYILRISNKNNNIERFKKLVNNKNKAKIQSEIIKYNNFDYKNSEDDLSNIDYLVNELFLLYRITFFKKIYKYDEKYYIDKFKELLEVYSFDILKKSFASFYIKKFCFVNDNSDMIFSLNFNKDDKITLNNIVYYYSTYKFSESVAFYRYYAYKLKKDLTK